MSSSNKIRKHDKLPLNINPLSRRMFIKGLGATLAIPFLPSLARAQSQNNFLYVFCQGWHGRWQGAWYPHGVTLPTVANGVRATRLSGINGPLGRIFNRQFDDLRDKINIIQGLDFMSLSGHDMQPYTASHRIHYSDGDPRNITPVFPYTIDEILAKSAKVYPNGAKIPVLRLNPKEGGTSFSISGLDSGGLAVYEPAQGRTLVGTYNYLKPFFEGIEDQSGMPVVSTPNQKQFFLDRVHEQYRRIFQSPQLSSEDKLTLESFSDHLMDFQRRLSSSVELPANNNVNCSLNQPAETTDNNEFNDRLQDMMVLAMACGITNIATYAMNYRSCASTSGSLAVDNYHNEEQGVHVAADNRGYDSTSEWTSNKVRHWGNIVRKMDALGLLDRAIVVYQEDMSSSVYNHHTADMPTLTAGTLGGQIRTGEFMSFFNLSQKLNDVNGRYQTYDLQQRQGSIPIYGGRRWNELLVSIFAASGMGANDYQRNGQGFGSAYCDSPPGAFQTACGNQNQYDTYTQYAMTQYYRNVYNQPLTSTLPYFYGS